MNTLLIAIVAFIFTLGLIAGFLLDRDEPPVVNDIEVNEDVEAVYQEALQTCTELRERLDTM